MAANDEKRLESLIFDDDLSTIDPLVHDLIKYEEERQARKIILIPSESLCSPPVRTALGSVFTNLYAEGYPSNLTKGKPEDVLSDLDYQLTMYRRYADRRFYKGNDYVNMVEAVCRRRVADCFANDMVPAERIYANVQPLSGAAANLAVYEAFVPRGETVMGLDLMQGGHLSHGSQFHMTGKHYNIVSYGIDPKTELIDYDEVMKLALEAKPKMIIAGFTSYPFAPDWAKFREIADACGAILMADISHPAGMAIAGAYPNPIGYADVITFTTHKTLMGPRSAVIVTTDEEKAQMVDMAVFPGEQGGPHLNNIIALATALKIAQTDTFKKLQHKIVENASHFAKALTDLGVRIAYGGTDTHLLLMDLKSISDKKNPLLGEPAARILELAGIVTNKNTIPGDVITPMATGIRMGTPWFTQRGAGKEQIEELARIIHKVVTNITPFTFSGVRGKLPRGKIDMKILEEAKQEVAALTDTLHPAPAQRSCYPHFFTTKTRDEDAYIKVVGPRAEAFFNNLVTGDLVALNEGETLKTWMLDADANIIDEVVVARFGKRCECRDTGFVLRSNAANAGEVISWLRNNADGYIHFDNTDVTGKIEGPAVVETVAADSPEAALLKDAPATDGKLAGTSFKEILKANKEAAAPYKAYFVGMPELVDSFEPAAEAPVFEWKEPENPPVKRTKLYDIHKASGGRMAPFAGYEMPLWYTSATEEHNAVRDAAGLFDVSHMGCFEISGPNAVEFLDLVTSNYIRGLPDGWSIYCYLMDQDGKIIDDLLVYRLHSEKFLMVVNASNEDKDWAWLNFVNENQGLIDRENPHRRVVHKATLRNLKDPKYGDECKVDIALQGPTSTETLMRLTDNEEDRRKVAWLQRTGVAEVRLAGIDLVIARTGYTGENFGYEILVNPEKTPELWNAILEKGKDLGVVPVGLAARDSTRTEAGLPLYGHELEGPWDMIPAGAGFAGYVKLHKPFFIGKKPYMARDAKRKGILVRFGVDEGGKPVRHGDLVFNNRGAMIGYVTSSAYNGNGDQIGLAFIQERYNVVDAQLLMMSAPTGRRGSAIDLSTAKVGDKAPLPIPAKVISRFPNRDKRGRRISGEVEKGQE